MTGFKNFILRGNLVDLAVGIIIGVAFAAVVTKFTEWLTSLLPQSLDNVFENKQDSFGAFLNALIAFLIMAAVVYFFVVVPFTKAKEKYFPDTDPDAAEDIQLLTEIRDTLQAQQR